MNTRLSKCVKAVFVVGMVVAGAPHQGAMAETYTLKVSSAYEKQSVFFETLRHLMDEVNAKCKTADGNIEMKWVGGPETFKARDLPDVTKAGSVDYFYGFPAYYAGMVPEYNLVSIPYAWTFENAEAIWKAGIGNQMDQATQRAGLKLIRFSAVIPFYYFATEPFKGLDDFKGKKLRVPGGLFSYLPQHMGATSVKLASAEVYMAMKLKTIDGGLQPLGSYTDFGYWEVAPYVLDYPLIIGGSGMEWMSLKKFNSLPKSLQNKLVEIANGDIGYSVKWWERKAAEWIRIMKSHGSKFLPISGTDRTRMQNIALRLKEQVVKKLPEGSEAAFKIYDKFAK